MINYRQRISIIRRNIEFFGLFLAISLLTATSASAFIIEVIDDDGQPVSGFNWLVEEDTTYHVEPGSLVSDSVMLRLHSSYAPVSRTGQTAESSEEVDLPSTGYFTVSVLPLSGDYTLGGGHVSVGQDLVRITVHSQPLPTAQISIFIFHDNNPLNNEPDQPGELGLQGFSVSLFDEAGLISKDAFSNPLGTTYVTNGSGEFIFDTEGNPVVDILGVGVILTDANGEVIVKYLPQGKYGVVVTPPTGQGWIQTSTIEGTRTVDAWVRAGEPPYMLEFAPGFYHIFIGFIKKANRLPSIPDEGRARGDLTGRLVYNHLSRPPTVLGYPGAAVPGAYVGLNDPNSLENLYVQAADANGTFTITGIPSGTYELVFWDNALDSIWGFRTVTIPEEGGEVNYGDITVNAWFGRIQGSVFYDSDEDGFRDPSEVGIRDQGINLRFRDGTIYKSAVTNPLGYYSIKEVFPFFHWLVMEVDFLRFKATGATFVVDDGGEVLPHNGWDWPSFGWLNPQPQADININTGNNLSRTETGQVLTEGYILNAGQTIVAEWGKHYYPAGENGGISGIVYYATTRAEDDPRVAGAEPWEPGIPRVQMNLYEDVNNDGIIDDLNLDGLPTLADVNNYPFDIFPGDEDLDRNDNNLFDSGDAIQVAYTDSWDDSIPDGCIGEPFSIHGQQVRDCYDGFRNFNQARPEVFDGGFAFASYFPGGMDSGSNEVEGLPAGRYIVEAATPYEMEIITEEDKNVDFGDQYTPSTLSLPPACVGDDHLVGPYLSLFDGVECFFAGETRPLCDRKSVELTDGQNAGVEFFFLTDVPKAARAVGIINNDLAAEFRSTSPVAGEKAAPSWIPVAFKDFTGHEVVRVYSDEWGGYNAMVPSAFINNLSSPAGNVPHIMVVTLNDPGPIPNPENPSQSITDPWYDPNYSTISYTLNFSPGRTTYLDTPVLPVGAFRDLPDVNIDCEPESGTPVIYSVSGPLGGPFVSNAGEFVTLISVGAPAVPNPDYDPDNPATTPHVRRDYTFGSIPGTVTINGVPLENLEWASDGLTIKGAVPAGMETGQIFITRGDNGKTSVEAVTLHVGNSGGGVIHVYPGDSIQNAIDNAFHGDLILVAPGVYDENVVLWKNVKLQGWGARSTIINAAGYLNNQDVWGSKVQGLIDSDVIDLVPGETAVDITATSGGPGILVVAKNGSYAPGDAALIDGLTIRGASIGGGILVNGYARYMQISNNRIMNNVGYWGGGIALGLPSMSDGACDPFFCESGNENIGIYNNLIASNTGTLSGGGISLHNGSDLYDIDSNTICANFSLTQGGGVSHYGRSQDGLIRHNRIIFNEVFFGGQSGGDGGGIFVGAEPLPGGGLSTGSGSVLILSNLIQGNLAGSGEGGGIRLNAVNGADVQDSIDPPLDWYEIKIFNNIIVNNATGYAGGGISLQDAARVKIIHNTIAFNDSAATSLAAFQSGIQDISTPQVAGLSSNIHSSDLAGQLGSGLDPEFALFSKPVLANSIIWGNRSFYYDQSINGNLGGLLPNTIKPIWDLAVQGGDASMKLAPVNCILSDTTSYAPSNISTDPQFYKSYFNRYLTASVADEGGNSVSLVYKPLKSSAGNYHLRTSSPAKNVANYAAMTRYSELFFDLDGQIRPQGFLPDLGADEIYLGTSVQPERIGVYRGGGWFLDLNGDGIWRSSDDLRYNFGGSGFDPVTGDWDGDGRTDIGTSQNGDFYLDLNGNGQWDGTLVDRFYHFDPFNAAVVKSKAMPSATLMNKKIAAVTDKTFEMILNPDTRPSEIPSKSAKLMKLTAVSSAQTDLANYPVSGDWNDDGLSEIGVYSNGTWYLDFNGNGVWDGPAIDLEFSFGSAGEIPVTGDWNHDGITEIGVYSNGTWYLDMNGNGIWDGDIPDRFELFGSETDTPVSGDWTGNGYSNIGIYDTGYWALDLNDNGLWNGCVVDRCGTLGRAGYVPVTGRW